MVCTFLRLFKVPEGWLQYLLALRRDPKVPGMYQANSDPVEDSIGADASGIVQPTPASILLQIGNMPDPAETSINGDLTENGPHGGKCASDRLRHGSLRGRRTDRDKPR
jgi:hypothetical protein